MFAAAVPVAVAVASRVEGKIAVKNASLKRAKGFGTCSLDDAAAVIVTEEGIGFCYYYPYESVEEADKYFNAVAWRCYSRIMFSWHNGAFVRELRHGGLHYLPFETIRRSARRFNINGKVFVRLDTLGLASLHFVNARTAYISFESDKCAAWFLDDGSPLPKEKYFTNTSYDRRERRFQGLVDWSPTSFCGDQLFEYNMVFDEEFSSIIDGKLIHYTPLYSDRSSTQQVLHFKGTPDDGTPNVLRYMRWHGECPDYASDSSSLAGDMCSMADVRLDEELLGLTNEPLGTLDGARASMQDSHLEATT